MSIGERTYDLAAEPVKGTAKGIWGGLKKGAVILGVTAALLTGWGMIGLLGASLWLAAPVAAVAGVIGLGLGGAGGAYAGGVLGGLAGMFNGIRKFFGGRDDNQRSPTDVQLQMLQQQAALEEQQTAALQRQMARAAAVDGANPGAATNNVDKITARQAQAASVAVGGRTA